MSTLYFLVMYDPANPARDFGLVKVGITDGDVADRIAQLQTGNPHELRCIADFQTSCAREVEHFVHRSHAAEMQHLEWLRWPRDNIATLVDEARQAATRIEDLKSKEQALATRVSNGKERRPTANEIELHREVQELKKHLIPAELRLKVAEGWLHAATGTTLGIHGVVRVARTPSVSRFNARQANETFPSLAEQCSIEKTSGKFYWRKVPLAWHFVEANQAAEEAFMAAEKAARDFLAMSIDPEGWTPRASEHERHHEEFLIATQLVTRLEGDLAILQSELTLRLDDFDALEGVCSYVRRLRPTLDATAFRNTYPEEAAQCVESIPAQLRKQVYPSRSYWPNLASGEGRLS